MNEEQVAYTKIYMRSMLIQVKNGIKTFEEVQTAYKKLVQQYSN